MGSRHQIEKTAEEKRFEQYMPKNVAQKASCDTLEGCKEKMENIELNEMGYRCALHLDRQSERRVLFQNLEMEKTDFSNKFQRCCPNGYLLLSYIQRNYSCPQLVIQKLYLGDKLDYKLCGIETEEIYEKALDEITCFGYEDIFNEGKELKKLYIGK